MSLPEVWGAVFCGVLGTPTIHVLLHFEAIIFRKCGVLGPGFFENFLKISKQNFWTFFKIEKTIILVFKLVRNHHLDQNLAKFSLKTPKSAIFPLKTFIFSKFSAPSAPKMWSFRSLRDPIFVELGSPLRPEVPPPKPLVFTLFFAVINLYNNYLQDDKIVPRSFIQNWNLSIFLFLKLLHKICYWNRN